MITQRQFASVFSNSQESFNEYQLVSEALKRSGIRPPSVQELERFAQNAPWFTWENFNIPIEMLPVAQGVCLEIPRKSQNDLERVNFLTNRFKKEYNFLIYGHSDNVNYCFDRNYQETPGETYSACYTPEMINGAKQYVMTTHDGIIMHGHTHPEFGTGTTEHASLADYVATYSWCVSFQMYGNENGSVKSGRAQPRKNVVISNIVANGKNHFFWYNNITRRFERIVEKKSNGKTTFINKLFKR